MHVFEYKMKSFQLIYIAYYLHTQPDCSSKKLLRESIHPGTRRGSSVAAIPSLRSGCTWNKAHLQAMVYTSFVDNLSINRAWMHSIPYINNKHHQLVSNCGIWIVCSNRWIGIFLKSKLISNVGYSRALTEEIKWKLQNCLNCSTANGIIQCSTCTH